MTKQEIDAMIDNGITAKIHSLLGVFSCNFFPFEEDTLPTNNDGEYDIEQIIKERNSTVYRGIRFYFDTPEQLKAFCMALEQKGCKMWWKLKQLFCLHKWVFFTEYDESNNRNSHHYTIWQCDKCDKVKITRK